MLTRVLVLLVGCALGIIIIWKRRRIVEVVGPLGFAEQYLGPGGTYTFILICGVLVFVGALMYSTGSLQQGFSRMFGVFF